MTKQFFKDSFGWGIGLWFIGYILGIIFFMLLPKYLIGWAVTPIGLILTLWVLLKKIKGDSAQYFLKVGIIWTVVAIVFDYLFNVLLFKLGTSYYQLDIYLYYVLTFTLPAVVGWRKNITS